jgi:hypothetical protein
LAQWKKLHCDEGHPTITEEAMPPKVKIKQSETGKLKLGQVAPTFAMRLTGDWGSKKGERNGELEASCHRPMDFILVFQSKISK